MNELLKAADIYKTYEQPGYKLEVLKGVHLTVCAGEAVAIIGPSGAGKSTLLHILGGLDAPSRGQVVLEGRDIYKLNDRDRANIRNKNIGFVFQFYHLLPELNALENVVLPAFIKEDMRQRELLEKKAKDLLCKVGLKERTHHRPAQLSGGEQQRVAIARSLMNHPQIIFCDEPTGNLDSQSGQEVIKLLMDLNQQLNMALVIVTHDEKVARLAKKIISMRDGQFN